MPNPSRPSGLELQALSFLYSVGPSTVAVILENIPDGKDRAYTTILSVMQSLERKGLVKPTRKGRSYIYKPTRSQASIVSPHVKDFLLNAFGGSVYHAILHLLSTGALTPEEKTAVERNLNKQRAMAAKKKTTKRKAAAKRKPARKAAKRSPAKKKAAKRKPAKKKAAKRKPAKKKAAKRKPAKKKAAKRKPAKKKAAKRKPAKKKAAKRKPAKKKAAKRKPAKKKAAKRKPAKKKAAKRKPAKKKAAKRKPAKRKAARKRR